MFLSSTFVDFQEERSLLVQQVFPSLRRRARSREVEIVDVDLRWGVTAEQTERGETLPLCLGEIDRCRPYFISLLGERYGWVPPPNYYKPELLERQPWLKERMGGASVTELEILHGVLRNPEMAGHAFFYLRDPAYAQAQSEPGWVADNPAERQRLEALKAQIRASGFPVAEGLPTPKAIAERIEADLWQLIESRFPEQEPADALEREDRRHSDYRRTRTGLYLGGGPAIEQLERWITEGEQRILITGESGAGKSALIANWLEAHQRGHPQDLVHAHHLGCTNDASAVRPLLGRLIDTASKLLVAEQQISEPIHVPQDWWELVFKVGEVFALLSPWCKRQGRRWILVLDGLDRLAEDDQQALPWIPTTIPPGIHVVTSALDCPARTILQERQYRTHAIGPLGKAEQQQLIERYLSRYTKQLESGLQQQILAHPLAGSPLFLRVLLEELRQCAWFDTLQEQVEFYLSAETIDGLYAKVLERLENDGHSEATRKALTALWASRAGLSEEELLAITGSTPLQWAPIDLALEQFLGRNGNRLVFDHDYLRMAIGNRYLIIDEQRQQAHSELADWFEAREGWDQRDSEELPWQLQQANRLDDLRDWMLKPSILANLQWDRGSREVLHLWLSVNSDNQGELDQQIAVKMEEEIEKRKDDVDHLFWHINRISDLLEEAGLYRELLLRLRILSLQLDESAQDRDEVSSLISLAALARAQKARGDDKEAHQLYSRCLEGCERLLGPEHPLTLSVVGSLAGVLQARGDYRQAEALYRRDLEASQRLLGPDHPHTICCVGNLAGLLMLIGDYIQSETHYGHCLEACERLLGAEHPFTLATVGNLAGLLKDCGDYKEAEALYRRDLEASERLLGPEHPYTLTTVSNLGRLFQDRGDYEQAEALYRRGLEASERLLGTEHPHTLTTMSNLGSLFKAMGDYDQAEILYSLCLESREWLLGREHPDTLHSMAHLASLFYVRGDYEKAETLYGNCLEARERLLGQDHPHTIAIIANLGLVFQAKGEYQRAEGLYRRGLETNERMFGPEHPDTLCTLANLAGLFYVKNNFEQAAALFMRCLEARERLLGPCHPRTLSTLGNLGLVFRDMGDYEQAEELLSRCLKVNESRLGEDHPYTLTTAYNLAGLFEAMGDYEQAEALYCRCLRVCDQRQREEHPITSRIRFNLANSYSDHGRYGESITLRRRILELSSKNHGRHTEETLLTIHRLAEDLYWAEQLDESEKLYRDSLSGRIAALGDDHADTMASRFGLARCLSAQGRLAVAISLRRIELAWCEREHGSEDPGTLSSLYELGCDLRVHGEVQEAEDLLRRCLAAQERTLGPENPDTLSTAYQLAELLSESDRSAEAIPLRRRELAWCVEHDPEGHGTLHSRRQLAIDLRAVGDFEEAEFLFRRLVSDLKRKPDPPSFELGHLLGDLARALEQASRQDESLSLAHQALEAHIRVHGPDGWWTNHERFCIARLLHAMGRNSEALSSLITLVISLDDKEDQDGTVDGLLDAAFSLRQRILAQMNDA